MDKLNQAPVSSVQIGGSLLVPGQASGRLLVSNEPLSFWGGYNPADGEIIDRRHSLSGQYGTARILAIPGTRGSSTTTAVLLEAIRNRTSPIGFIVTAQDTFLALASVVADEMYGIKIPVLQITEDWFSRLKTDQAAEITPKGILIIPNNKA